MAQLRRTAANAVAYDLDCEMLTPDAGPGALAADGTSTTCSGRSGCPATARSTRPTSPSRSHAARSRRGARIVERVRVTGFDVADGPSGRRVTGVRTDAGDIECEIGGQLRRPVGQGARRPGRASRCRCTPPSTSTSSPSRSTGVHPDLPIMRDPDGWTYFKEEVGGLVVGGFEPDAKPWRAPVRPAVPVRVPAARGGLGALLAADGAGDRAHPGARGDRRSASSTTARSRSPRTTSSCSARPPGCAATSSAPASTPSGIASAGGAGRALAEWIVEGEPTSDLVAVDVRRFAPFHGDEAWLRSRVAEMLGLHYDVPVAAAASPRPGGRSGCRRCTSGSPRGAPSFGTRMGWERPLSSAPPPPAPARRTPGAGPTGSTSASAEQRATRERVAVFDQTSFSLVRRRGAGRPGRAAVDLRGRRRRAGGRLRLHAVPQRARHLRGRPHRHPHRPRLLPAGVELGDHDPRPGLDPSATSPPVPTSRSTTAPTRCPCSA